MLIFFKHLNLLRPDRVLVFAILLWTMGITAHLSAQEFESLDNTYKDKEPAYSARLSLEYLDNKRDTEETGYYDLSQKQIQKEGHGNLKIYFINMDGHYKAYDSAIRIGEDKTSLFDVRSTISARAEILDYIYLFAQQRDQKWRYKHVDDGVRDFYEKEKASAYLQGIGVILGDWRFGLSPGTSYLWSYHVDIDGQSIIDTEIEFKTRVWELAKKASDTQGPFYELGLKHWNDEDIKNGQSGSLERSEIFVMLGIGFSEDTTVYLGGKSTRGRIETVLEADNSDAVRKSEYTNNVLGFRFGIGEESNVYIEQRFLKRKIDFENVSYENTHRYEEEKLTLGTRLNHRFSFELKFGKTRINKSYSEHIVADRSYRYKQTDNLVGISVNMRFSE